MPNWAIHLIVPLFVLLIVGRKEERKYMFLLLPLAVVPDLDTFVTQHRALLHNMFIPLILSLFGLLLKEKRILFATAAFYIALHVIMDMFGGGVVLFYPFYNRMAFVDASLQVNQIYELTWIFDCGFKPYDTGWADAYGFISDSVGTGALALVFLAFAYSAHRRHE